MKSDRINYVLVGAFVIAIIAGVVIAVALLTGRTGITDDYYTSYEDATGLKFGSQVLYMGYPVGQVEEITPVRENGKVRFRVTLAISEKFNRWNVPKDSVARIRSPGLLAAVTIDIRSGTSEEALKPGDHLEGVGQVDVFSAVSDAANTLKLLTEDSIKPLVENLGDFVAGLGPLADGRGGDLITNLNILASELAARAPDLISNLISVSEEVRLASETLRTMLGGDGVDKAGAVVDNMVVASENVVALTEETRQQVRTLLGPDTSKKVEDALLNISSASANFARLSDEVNRSLKNVLTPETAEKLKRSLDNFALAAANISGLTRDLGSTREELDRFLASLSGSVEENRPHLRRSMLDLRHTLRSVAQQIDAITYNLEGTSRNMLELSKLLRRDPSILLRGATAGDDAATPTGTTP